MAVPEKYEHIDFKPPKNVADAAERGLEYRRRSGKGGLSSQEAGKAGIGSGVQRAVNLKNRNNISPETFSMMRGFFSRHEKNKSIAPKNKETPWEDAGHVAWLLWGGDPGKKWVEKIIKQMEDADKQEEKEKEMSKSKKADVHSNLIDQWIAEFREWLHPNTQAKFNTYGWEVVDFRPSLGTITLTLEGPTRFHTIKGRAKNDLWVFAFDGQKLKSSGTDLELALSLAIKEVGDVWRKSKVGGITRLIPIWQNGNKQNTLVTSRTWMYTWDVNPIKKVVKVIQVLPEEVKPGGDYFLSIDEANKWFALNKKKLYSKFPKEPEKVASAKNVVSKYLRR